MPNQSLPNPDQKIRDKVQIKPKKKDKFQITTHKPLVMEDSTAKAIANIETFMIKKLLISLLVKGH
jgi:hypothetical protein